MFPNIDNNLGISAVKKALDLRSTSIPSTECIVEAVTICLESNNSQFLDNHFVQIHGTAMGPKNACSYADLAMGEIDILAKQGGDIKPKFWWRYRDDIIDIWTQGQQKLMEFTDYINSLYPTIKFELVYSTTELNVLDLTLHLKDGFISTDIYAKPTDSHLYLNPSSSHPQHVKKAIPLGVALRIKRNCSTNDFLEKRCYEYKQYLEHQNYPPRVVEEQFRKALNTDREQLLKPKVKDKRKIYPLVLDYNPKLPEVSKIINRHFSLLSESNELGHIFTPRSIIPAFRRTKTLKEILAPSRLKSNQQMQTPGGLSHIPGCFKCKAKCDLCAHFLLEAETFNSISTTHSYRIKERVGCNSTNVIYLLSCTKCNLQYVGSTSTPFKVRFRNHKSAMRTNKKSCETAVHFNSLPHELADFKFIIIEAINDTCQIDKKLLTREAYWTAQLRTMYPDGLNKRNEFKSKNRINYGS